MRVVRGAANAVLMVTLIKPLARLMVGRWRKQVQESPAASLGIPMQEMLEAALVEELGPATTESQAAELEAAVTEAGRSTLRLLLLAGIVIAATTATAYAVASYIGRRRKAQAEEHKLVAVSIETDSPQPIEDVAQEALSG